MAQGIIKYFNYYLALEWESLLHSLHMSAAGRWKRIFSSLSLITRTQYLLVRNSIVADADRSYSAHAHYAHLLECILPVLQIRKQRFRGWIYTTGRAEVEIWARLPPTPHQAVLPTAAVVLAENEGDVHA